MRQPGRTWCVIKWLGTALCVLLLAAFFASGRWTVTLISDRMHWLVQLCAGSITLSECYPDYPLRLRSWLYLDQANSGPQEYSLCYASRPYWGTGLAGRGNRFVMIPGWMPVIALAVPTGLLWWRDRRRIPPGHCQKCGYNLTANVSGRCPECGTPIQSAGRHA